MDHNRISDYREIAGTHLVGSVITTRRRLEAVFGFPTSTGESKIRYHWAIKFSDDIIATLYDWKEYREIGLDEPYEWHIGGKSRYVVDRILGMV